ncbi:MAG: glycosyltransferase family 4 protein [Bacteroidota bacterium]
MKRKVTYILANIDKAFAFEWISFHLDKEKFDLSFILLNNDDTEIESYLRNIGVPVIRIKNKSKRYYPLTFFRLVAALRKFSPDIIHCHIFDAAFLGLMAGKLLGIKKRIYTRHHASYNHQFVKKMIPFDKVCNRCASDIVAISKNVENVLMELENVPKSKIRLIHHGFDLKVFESINFDKVNLLKQRYGTENKYPVIGVIARWFELKGIEYVIDAFKKLLNDYPDAHLVLANAKGPHKEIIEQKLSTIPKTNCTTIQFEKDLPHLYCLFDVFTHVPINESIEAFGQIYIEALAAEVPSIFTLSGVAPEFITHKENAMVVNFKSSEEILKAMKEILINQDLREKLIRNGKFSIQKFDLIPFIQKLEQLYEG